MKIISINYGNLKLADFMNLIFTILTYSKSDEELMRLCPNQVAALENGYKLMEEIYARHRKNLLTPEIEEKDGQRDKQYAYVRRIIDAERRSLDAVRVKAADELWIVLEDYGRMDNVSYTSQTTKIMSLCQDMTNSHATALETLNLQASVELLNQLNNEFQQLFFERFESVTGRLKGEMADARQSTEKAYATLRLVVCGLYEWQYAAQLHPFVSFVNTVIPRYRILIGQSNANDVDSEEEEEEIENEVNGPDNTNPEGGTTDGEQGGENNENQQPGEGDQNGGGTQQPGGEQGGGTNTPSGPNTDAWGDGEEGDGSDV